MLISSVKSRFAAGVDRLGNANPQLLREWRGALSLRSLGLTAAGSLLLQGIYLLFLWQRWGAIVLSSPLERCQKAVNHYGASHPSFSSYWMGTLFADRFAARADLLDAVRYDGQACSTLPPDLLASYHEIYWPAFWFDSFFAVTLFAAIVLPLVGAFLLAENLGREARRGTLDFLRASPRSSQGILAGKLAGSPVLVYLGALSLVPLQLVLADRAAVPLADVLGVDALVAAATVTAGAIVLAGVAAGLRVALLNAALAFAGLIPAGILGFGYLSAEHPAASAAREWSFSGLQWFGLSLKAPAATGYGFASLSLLVLAFGLWRAANRRFREPQLSLASKRGGYAAMAIAHGWLLGFGLNPLAWADVCATGSCVPIPFRSGWTVAGLGFFVPAIAFALLLATLPNRQALADWARYRHLLRSRPIAEAAADGAIAAEPEGPPLAAIARAPRRRHPWIDALLGERSPIFLAAIAQVALAAVLWWPGLFWGGMLSGPEGKFTQLDWAEALRLAGLTGLVLGWTVASLSLVQWLSSLRSRYPLPLAAGGLLAFWIVPPAIAYWLLGAAQSEAIGPMAAGMASLPWYWLQGWAYSDLTHLPAGAIALALALQGAAIGGFVLLTRHQLARLGRSDLQALLESEPRRSR